MPFCPICREVHSTFTSFNTCYDCSKAAGWTSEEIKIASDEQDRLHPRPKEGQE